MSSRLDELARLAANSEPPALDEVSARRMIERAIDRSIERSSVAGPHSATRRSRAWVLAVCVLAAAIASLWLAPHDGPATSEALSSVSLPTGDHLIGDAGARFNIEQLEPAHRRLRLVTGAVLFDVAHVVADQQFEVVTTRAIVLAKSTLFSVATDADATRVRVYEGGVDIVEAGATRSLSAGEAWRSGGADVADSPELIASAEEAIVEHAIGVLRAPARALAPSTAQTPPPPTTAQTPGPQPLELDAPSRRPAAPTAIIGDQLARARADIDAGRFAEALAKVDQARTKAALSGAWLLVLADASRGLGRPRDAAVAYERAAATLTGAERVEAGYSAAYLYAHDVHDADAALNALARSGAADDDSPLQERGLALQVQIFVAEHRDADAKQLARHYLASFPHGDLIAYMRAIAAP